MLQFGIVNGGSDFFVPVQDGWETACNRVSSYSSSSSSAVSNEQPVLCHYRQENNNQTCQELVQDLLQYDLDGLALIPCFRDDSNESSALRPAFLEMLQQSQIPLVTFDSDHDTYQLLSNRITHIATDQHFLGRTLAKLLRQLRPEGGIYAHVGGKEDRMAGFDQEMQRYNDREGWGEWKRAPAHNNTDQVPPEYQQDWITKIEYYILVRNATSIITMKQSPMRHPNWTALVDQYPHVLFLGTDGADYQLDYLHRGYVDGLVGQLPFDMGQKALDTLYGLAVHTKQPASNFTPTNMVAYNRIPIELPSLEVDEHLLTDNNLQYVGYTCFGIVAFVTILSLAWTLHNRNDAVVRAAQPFFLIMICTGVLIMSSSIIPLGMEDGGIEEHETQVPSASTSALSESDAKAICMSVPWLAFTGFTIIFSALFSKTWRVNQLFQVDESQQFSRIKVTEMDVLKPFLVLLVCNFILLICWTTIDPLVYTREDAFGTDYWNRVLSSHGGCRSQSGDTTAVAYLIPLALINVTAVLIACYQAHRARGITSEFSESRYIGMTVFSLFQAMVTGIPVVAVVRDNPEAFYLILTFTIFVLSMAVMLLIFLPKMLMQRKYAKMSEREKRQVFQKSVQASSKFNSSRFLTLEHSDSQSKPEKKISGLRASMKQQLNLSLLKDSSGGKLPSWSDGVSTEFQNVSRPFSSLEISEQFTCPTQTDKAGCSNRAPQASHTSADPSITEAINLPGNTNAESERSSLNESIPKELFRRDLPPKRRKSF